MRPEATRILIFGVTGAGKTTLAQDLAALTGLPHYSVDDLTWEPGWVEVPLEDQILRVSAICEKSEWILDSAYGKWQHIPLAHADLILALDYSRTFCFFRLLIRTLKRLLDGKLVCNGNRETFRQVFSRKSILLWQIQSWPSKRERIRAWAANPDGPRVIQLSTPRQTKKWLASLT